MVKSRATLAKIWDLVDPEILNEQIRTPPSYPTFDDALHLKADERYTKLTLNNVLSHLTNQYSIQSKDYYRKEQALQNLFVDIQKSVSANLYIYLTKSSTPYQALKSLKQHLAPSDEARYYDIDRQYRTLCTGKPKGQTIEHWLEKWDILFAEAIDIGHPDFQRTMARNNFIQSTYSVDHNWAAAAKYEFQKATIKGETPSTFAELMEQFRQSCRTNDELALNTLNIPASSFAILQGRHPPTSERQVPVPKCPIEGTHYWYSDCPYFNEASQPTNWTPDLLYIKKTEEALANPFFKDRVDTAIARSNAFLARSPIRTPLPSAPKELPTKQAEKPLPRSFAVTYVKKPTSPKTLPSQTLPSQTPSQTLPNQTSSQTPPSQTPSQTPNQTSSQIPPSQTPNQTPSQTPPIHLPAKHRLPTSAKQYSYKLPQQTVIQTPYPSKPLLPTPPSNNAPTPNSTPLPISSSYYSAIYTSDEEEEIMAQSIRIRARDRHKIFYIASLMT